MRTNLKATLANVKSYDTKMKHVYGKRYCLPLNCKLSKVLDEKQEVHQSSYKCKQCH